MRPGRGAILAGWLVADLVLALVLVGLANSPVEPASAPAPVKPSVSATPVPPGMDKPVEFRVAVKPSDLRSPRRSAAAEREVLTAVRNELAKRGLSGKRAGFVEVFAAGPTDDIRTSLDTAEAVLRNLQRREPAMFGKASGDGYWGGTGDDLNFKIFFYN
ncbi:hypothetical protein ACQPZX_16010 [Actinoplanes sp. CA-142083]|uniref:hypothetical protein n=1 Tax=Actinoplanes sp. CA-142083 TaxID=3239903 RepID=UPI003D8E36B4